ncbi:MAG TPA: Por secretion system protein, partial [Bacteroidales bacterium]|nr:Por secretion system protein [Bacteroidales bacterium]
PADIVVRNLSGQVICAQKTTASDLTIELAAGFYLVTIQTSEGEMTRKVVVH